MPFKSEKQRRYLWATRPALAREWADKYPTPKDLPMYASDSKKKKQDSAEEVKTAAQPVFRADEINRDILNIFGLPATAAGFVKKADSKQEKIDMPTTDGPVYAGQTESNPSESEGCDETGAKPDTGSENAINMLLQKLSVVLSPALAKVMAEQNAAQTGSEAPYTPKNVGLKQYNPAANLITPPMGSTPQQPAQPQAPAPQAQPAAASRSPNPVGGRSASPSMNPIQSFGALSMDGNINGNAAFGAKNSPDSSKVAAAIMKWAKANTPCSCGCGDTVKTCKCSADCACRKPGGSCYKGEKTASKPGLWANIHAKRKRGEKPAKPGDKDYPDAKSWKKTTKSAGAHAAEKQATDPISLGLAAGLGGLGAVGGSLAGAYFFGSGPNSRKSRLAAKELADYWAAQKTMNREQHYKKQMGYRNALQRDPTEASVRNYLKHWGSKGFESDDDWEDLEEDLPFKPFNTPGAFESDYLVDDLHADIGNRLRDPKQFDAAFRELLPRLNLKTQKTAGSPAWQRAAGKNDEGGLNAKGRASYNRATGGNLKAPVTESNPKGERKSRRASFCARMGGMKKKLTGKDTARDPDSRINKALRKWNCKSGAYAFGKQAAKRVLNLSPSWGGGKYQLGEMLLNPQIGYRYLGGVIPTPDIGLRLGGFLGGNTIGLAPLPYLETDWGRPSGWQANKETRSLYKWLGDGMRDRTTASHHALANLPEDAAPEEIERVLRNQGVGYSSRELKNLSRRFASNPAAFGALAAAQES